MPVGVGLRLRLRFIAKATGVEAAVYYTPETLEAAGIREESMLMLATVGVGMIKASRVYCPTTLYPARPAASCGQVIFIVISAFLVESYGRIPLLLFSCAGSCSRLVESSQDMN